MCFNNSIFKAGITTLIVLIAWAALVGCASDNGDYSDSGNTDANSYVLRLSVSAVGNTATRAASHELSDATEAENYIDIFNGDYTIVIYDNNGKFIQQVSADKTTPKRQDDMFWVESVIEESFIEEIQQVGDEFQVMVLANLKSYNNKDDAYPKFDGQTTATLWGNANDYNFSRQINTSGENTWYPSIEDERFIPMFGIAMAKISDAKKEFDGYRHILLDVPMLRALAKIEIIDAIEGKGAIKGVTMTRYNTSGRLIPNISENKDWNDNKTQITTPSLPNNGNTADNLQFLWTKNAEGQTVWYAYIPEMRLGTSTTIEANRPRLDVQTDIDGNTATYPLHFARYDTDGNYSLPNNTSWNYILRNHIYRYTITSVNVTANLQVKVLPWEVVEDSPWDYTDNIIIEEGNFLEWKENSVLSDNKQTATVTLKGNTTDIAEAKFKISAPKGGKWYALFVPLEGREDAFTFVDEAGNELLTPSGDVGVDGYIRIKNRYATVNDRNNRAKLVIMVMTVDGRWMEADLCDGTLTNYTIIQNITNI